jgi:hypothetical protein
MLGVGKDQFKVPFQQMPRLFPVNPRRLHRHGDPNQKLLRPKYRSYASHCGSRGARWKASTISLSLATTGLLKPVPYQYFSERISMRRFLGRRRLGESDIRPHGSIPARISLKRLPECVRSRCP